MNRCEHGERITKFCVTDHCHHKQAAGCDYCIRKYHFHLTNTQLLSEPNIEQLIKKVTLPVDCKYKTRNLQEAAIDYLRNIKNTINTWIEQAQKTISDRLTFPLLRKEGMLATYNYLKYRNYRKVNARDLRVFNEFVKNQAPQTLKKEEVSIYYQEVEWTKDVMDAAQKMANEIARLPEVKEGEGAVTLPNKTKVNEVLQSIARDNAKRQGIDKEKSVNSSSRHENTKFQDSTLFKRRQGSISEKLDTGATKPKETKKIENNVSIAFEKESQKNEEVQALTNISSETRELKEQENKRLKRRRSSIDEKFDPQFGGQASQKAKEFEDRRRKVLEDLKEKDKKEPEKDDSVIGNILNLKYGKRDEIKKQEERGEPVDYEKKEGLVEEEKEQKLQKALGLFGTVMDNILPPLADDKVQDKSDSPVESRVVRIPVVARQKDEIQSPIFKQKRKQATNSGGGGFGIKLNPTTTDEVTESKTQEGVKAKNAQSEFKTPEVSKTKKEQDEKIVLEHKQKNSLLLFSQSLRSDGQRAIELLKASLKYSPNNLSAAEYLSYLYLQGGRAKECLEVCESILLKIEDTPQQFELTLHLHNNRAAALNMLGRYSESIMILEKCLRSRRKHYFYKNLADAYFSLGIPEKAAMNYEKSVKLDPQYDQAYYNLAVTQFMQEEYTSALLNIRQAMRIEPSNEVYYQLQREIVKRKDNIAM